MEELELRAKVAHEREVLLQYVFAARKAISELRPTDMRGRRLPSAMNEIGMIVETTENAANQIMDAVSDMMQLPGELPYEEYRAAVEARCMAVLEACAFQDLTGQRSNKVVETLLLIEDKLSALSGLLAVEDEAPVEEHAPGQDLLLNGPAMPGEGVDQDDIDRLFATG